jgi:predicted amidohydrolase
MLTLESLTPWSPHPSAAPGASREGETLITAANGTRTCVGGWQLIYAGVTPGQSYAIETRVLCQGFDHPRDHLQCVAYWEAMPVEQARNTRRWDYLLPNESAPGQMRFARMLTAPPGATHLTLRYTFRWTTAGRAIWSLPRIAEIATSEPRRPVKIALATGAHYARQGLHTVASNTALYSQLCEAACQAHPDLILLPEVCLQWQVNANTLDVALPLDSPEVETFRRIARRHSVHLALGLFEREGDAVFNTVALFDPQGALVGSYHKVHLAVLGESDSGVLAGETFPVYETPLGRIGFNICMDTSAAESSRMVGLNGADFMLMPIMGDHRADRWSAGRPYYSESRWQAIMRTHAMDNQLCMVVARNEAHGSCIIDRKGDILAWNEGLDDYVTATVNLDDGYRTWNDACFREVNWLQRRPHLYGAFVDENNVGSLR